MADGASKEAVLVLRLLDSVAFPRQRGQCACRQGAGEAEGETAVKATAHRLQVCNHHQHSTGIAPRPWPRPEPYEMVSPKRAARRLAQSHRGRRQKEITDKRGEKWVAESTPRNPGSLATLMLSQIRRSFPTPTNLIQFGTVLVGRTLLIRGRKERKKRKRGGETEG